MKFSDVFYVTPLYVAVKKGNIEIVKLLISRKELDVNMKSEIDYIFSNKILIIIFAMEFFFSFNVTPLYEAIDQNSIEMVQLLLSRKEIDVNIKSISNHFIFHIYK